MVDRIHLPPASENHWGPEAARLGAPRAIIDLIERRGLCRVEDIEPFLFGGSDVLESRILPPTGDLGLAGLDRTLDILVEARERREPVIVHGDYDVDGMTGTALLFLALRRAGLVTGWTLPRRSTEGYGLTDASLARCLSGEGIEGLPVGNDRPPRWVVSVDTGITAGPAVERAAALGLGVIVTDHHLPSGDYPEAAAAVINPRRPDCPYPNKHLSGVGVAWKLSVALLERLGLVPEADPKRLLQLVALGTLADMVSVTGENRALIRLGLRELFERPIPGARALCQIAGIKGTRPPRATDILFRMTPRINAAGRMRCGEVAIRVMVSDSGERAAAAAKDLDDINTQRQKIDQRITTVAMKMAEEAIARAEGAVPAAFVLQDAGWHEGVSGIIAARILDQWHRPAVILAPDPGRPGEYRGSARCDMGFDIHAALSGCSDLLERWGGHAQAAGLSIREERVPEFARRFVESAELVRAKGPAGEPAIRTDAEVSLAEIDVNFMEWLERLEPFGPGNEPPVFWAQNVSVQSVGRVGGGKHLRLRVRQGETSFDAIGFGLGALADRLSDPAAPRQAAFSPEWNDFRGARTIQLNLKGLS